MGLFGVVLDTPLAVVMELMKGGSLYTRLHENSGLPKLTFAQRVKIAQDIASGLAFIHEHSIIHCDIRSRNILVSKIDLVINLVDG